MFRKFWRRTCFSFNRLVMVDSRFTFALFIGFWSGIVGVCVDLDHFTMLWGHPHGRIAHTPLVILAGIVGFYCLARIGGLLFRVVLRAFYKSSSQKDAEDLSRKP